MRSLAVLGRSLVVALGCAGAAFGFAGCDPSGTTEQNQGDGVATLEIHALDIWGQPLPVEGLELYVDGKAVAAQLDDGVLRIPLTDVARKLDLLVTAPEHGVLEAQVGFDGTSSPAGAILTRNTEGHGAAMSHELDDDGRPVHRLYLGLRHKWFSAEGRPARRGNQLDLLMDGEEAWKSVHADLTQAKKEVLVSTWWWESDFELVRSDDLSKTEAERKANTILGILEASPAQKRVLVGQLWGQDGVLSWLTVDSGLAAHGKKTGDGFEFMGQANPTRGKFTFQIPDFLYSTRLDAYGIASDGEVFDADVPVRSTVAPKPVDLTEWSVSFDTDHASVHQKFMVVDHEVAFIGGMNLRKVDWDTHDHRVFDARRMSFTATAEERQAVADKTDQPDNGPRKDYMVRLEGPAAEDAADVFNRRWTQAIADGVKYSDTATPFEVERGIGARDGGVQVQVTTTLPEPYWEHGIIESWLNAIGQAEDYVYIEDQYFRAPILNDALMARMKEKPELRLVVITKPINEWTDPGCRWTYESADLFAKAFPERFLLAQLESFDTHTSFGAQKADFLPIDVHSKMLIVDDKFMSVGSANKNNRGMLFEAEMNVAVLDAAWVGAARRRILENIMPPGAPISDDAAQWFDALAQAAKANDAVFTRWSDSSGSVDSPELAASAQYQPAGFVYSLPYGEISDCLMESVGPDMTGQADPDAEDAGNPGGPE